MTESTFKVSGVNCPACTKLISLKLKKAIEGIETIDVDLEGNIKIASKTPISADEVSSALAGTDHQII